MNELANINAANLAVLCSGLFFITGLLGGVWKYHGIRRSPDAQAPVYVDIFHRAALLYAFACLVLAEFARLSQWPESVNRMAVLVPVVFFALAVFSYAVHGLLRDTDNQLQRPHRLGSTRITNAAMSFLVWGTVVGELGGFLVLFAGAIEAMLQPNSVPLAQAVITGRTIVIAEGGA